MGKRSSISHKQLIVSCVLTVINTLCLIVYSFQNTWSRVHLFLVSHFIVLFILSACLIVSIVKQASRNMVCLGNYSLIIYICPTLRD